MSADTPQHPELDADGLKFAIIVARFNSSITEQLLASAEEALRKAGAQFEVFRVPGAFELPLAAKHVISKFPKFDGVIALGAVIRGETPHFDYVAGEAARGLQQVALALDRPVAFGVLTTDTVEQAKARANKGYDAAMTAIEMAHFQRS